jgi:hypothetical protein
MAPLILLVFAFVLFVLAGFFIVASSTDAPARRVNLVALGLACCALAEIVARWPLLNSR